jgi:hypothetical protein
MVDFHPSVDTLKKWETGVPVSCREEWPWEVVEQAVAKGAPKSASIPKLIKLIAEDVAYQVKVGYAATISWTELKKRRPKHLKVSPLAVVPQHNHRGQIILDLSFPVLREQGKKGRRSSCDIVQAAVNDTTKQLAPVEPVKELGNVLWRLLDFMNKVPADKEIHFAQTDLADGYWQIIVEPGQREEI